MYTSTGKGGGGLVKLTVDNEKVTADPVYLKKNVPTSIGGAVLLGKYLYGTNGKGLLCVEFATGDEKWQNSSVGAGSVCFADGRLYVHGECSAMRPSSKRSPTGYQRSMGGSRRPGHRRIAASFSAKGLGVSGRRQRPPSCTKCAISTPGVMTSKPSKVSGNR